MSKDQNKAGPPSDGGPSPASPEERRDRIKALIFFFGSIALVIALKYLLGY